MGALSDFLAGAFGNYGQQRAQMTADRRAEAADDRRFQKQLSYAKAAEAIKRNFEATSTPQIPQPYGLPIQRGPGNWEVATRIVHPAMYDEQSGAVTQPASVEEGPYMPAQDPNALTPWQAYQAERNRGKDEAYERRTDAMKRGGGMTADQVLDNTRAEEQLKLAREAAERARRADERQARRDAAEEAKNRAAPIINQIDNLKTEQDEAGGSELSRFMARLGAPRQAQMDPFEAKQWVRSQGGGNSQGKKADDSQGEVSGKPPVEGAKKAQDGNWYVQRNGKWYRVESD